MLPRPVSPIRLKPKIVFLIGPTAVGKSANALYLAGKINAEIVSMDSMQVYRGLDILSSKPTRQMRHARAHHLLDIVSPQQEFNAARYRRLALRKIREIHKRGKIPLFAGGTGLYMSVLLDGIFQEVKKDKTARKKLYAQAEAQGTGYLYGRLQAVDAAAASKIHPNDLRRIVRALEVYTVTGMPISELWRKRKGISAKYKVIVIGLNKDRQALYRDINERVEQMFAQGAVDEVRKFLSRKLSRSFRQAIGINEIEGFIEGRYGLEYAKELIKKNTRNYAKRQLTWFRKDTRVQWQDAGQRGIKAILVKMAKG